VVVKLPREHLYSIRDPAHFHSELLKDVKVLWEAGAFNSCVTLIVCFIDALAASDQGSDKFKFSQFMEAHFKPLCDELNAAVPNKRGAITFYEQFRNGLAHLRGPKSGYALARSTQTGEKYIEEFEVDQVGRYIGINVDRLYTDFVAAVEKCLSSLKP